MGKAKEAPEEAWERTVFEADGKTWELELSIGRLKLYERSGHTPITAILFRDNGTFTLEDLIALVGYSIKPEGGKGHVAPSTGAKMAEELIENSGYFAVQRALTVVLQSDCGFLFQVQREIGE